MNEKRLKEFWNKEYKEPAFLALSDEVADDLEKFAKWMQRTYGKDVFRSDVTVLDAGCGNGRNLLWLNEQFRVRGYGYDISEEAIRQAQAVATQQKWGSKLRFDVHSIGANIPLEDESVDIALDMMSSHFLKDVERARFINEIYRVLKPGGVLFFKSFYIEGDRHAKELIKNNSAGEHNAYIHPKMKVYEYVWTDEAIETSFGDKFNIEYKEASRRHIQRGKPNKRRSIAVYFEKK